MPLLFSKSVRSMAQTVLAVSLSHLSILPIDQAMGPSIRLTFMVQ